MDTLKDSFKKELTDNILPFWTERMKDPQGGFFGRMDGHGKLHRNTERGAVLNARIIWTLASAGRMLEDSSLVEQACEAAEYFSRYFIDREFGGCYWSVTCDGRALDTKKQFYAIAFAVYAYAELYRATADKSYLEESLSLMRSIEVHSRDRAAGGYIEACSRNWQKLNDMRLSEKDRNDAKTMNTHLHILEAYTGLCRVHKDAETIEALRNILGIFLEHIVREDGHLILFFDEGWNSTSDVISYGHEIEASWLLYEAAQVLGDKEIIEKVRIKSQSIAKASLEGYVAKQGMMYEYDPKAGHADPERHWWVQAETVVGSLYQSFLATEEGMTDEAGQWEARAKETWEFICRELICPDGEWYWSVMPDEGTGHFLINMKDDLAGPWKCPYHNGRMCLEAIGILAHS